MPPLDQTGHKEIVNNNKNEKIYFQLIVKQKKIK